MLLFMTLENAFELLEQPQVLFADSLIPAQTAIIPDSPYRPGYDWLFAYERDIARRLEPWLSRYRYKLIGEHGILCEALSNAFCHGHLKDRAKPIQVDGYIGRKGLLVRIKDSGKGFDVDRLYKNFQQGKAYFHIAGNGMRHMFGSDTFAIFYTHSGTAFHLLYLFDRLPADLDPAFKSPPPSTAKLQAPATIPPMKKTTGAKHIEFAILLDPESGPRAFSGSDTRLVASAARLCPPLVSAVDRLLAEMALGEAEFLSIRTEKDVLIVSKETATRSVLVAVLKPAVKPAMEKICASKLFKHFDHWLTSKRERSD